jgi:glycerophosphoryl diester phosphodiesterase
MLRKAPENTVSAYQCAIDHGFDIELDVQITRDEQLICIHDWQLGRTVPGTGMIWSYTLDELKLLDAGTWFSSAFEKERIPTFREALNLVKGKARLAIEMKCPGIDESLVKILEETDMLDQVYVFDIPQDFYFAPRLKSICPDIRVGRNCISEHDFDSLQRDDFRHIDVIMAITRTPWLTETHVKIAHDAGVEIVDTGVHDLEKMQRTLELGLDGLCSDCPDELGIGT